MLEQYVKGTRHPGGVDLTKSIKVLGITSVEAGSWAVARGGTVQQPAELTSRVRVRRSGGCPETGFWLSESARRPAESRPCKPFLSRCRPTRGWRSSS